MFLLSHNKVWVASIHTHTWYTDTHIRHSSPEGLAINKKTIPMHFPWDKTAVLLMYHANKIYNTHKQTTHLFNPLYLTHFPGDRVFNINKPVSNHLHFFHTKTILRTRPHVQYIHTHSLTHTPSPNTPQFLGQGKIYISSEKLRCLCTRWVCLSLVLTPMAHLISESTSVEEWEMWENHESPHLRLN